jgi:hypothetical protein
MSAVPPKAEVKSGHWLEDAAIDLFPIRQCTTALERAAERWFGSKRKGE